MTFIIGMRNPVQICARVPTPRRRSLIPANVPALRRSRPNAFTAWMPETVSSTWPFSAPRASCCCLNSARVLREIVEVRSSTRGTGTSDAAASRGLSTSMIASVPVTTTTLDIELDGRLRHRDADRVDVVGQPAHEVAVRAEVEERERQPLQLGEQPLADVAHHPLRHARHDPAVDGRQQRPAQVGGEQRRRGDRQRADRARGRQRGHASRRPRRVRRLPRWPTARPRPGRAARAPPCRAPPRRR